MGRNTLHLARTRSSTLPACTSHAHSPISRFRAAPRLPLDLRLKYTPKALLGGFHVSAKSQQGRPAHSSKWSLHPKLHTQSSTEHGVMYCKHTSQARLGPEKGSCPRLEASEIAVSRNHTPRGVSRQVCSNRNSMMEPFWKVCLRAV